MTDEERRRIERKADAALFLACYAAALAAKKPKRRSIGDRLWSFL